MIRIKCDYHIQINLIAKYARIDFICSLYDCELLYFSERLKKNQLAEACIVLHVSHSCSLYLLRSYDALHPYHTCIRNCKTKYEFAEFTTYI